ncbi:MAG: spore germination protein [Oscillospiraceae bacterium]|nr:spore germination protein [Oscillospiraceae bacterium]
MPVPDSENYKALPLEAGLDANILNIKRITGNTSDLLVNEFKAAGIRCALLCLEGMVSTGVISKLILNPLTAMRPPENSTPEELHSFINSRMLLGIDRPVLMLYGELIQRLMSGFAVIMIDGMDTALGFGVQGYAARGVDEPSGEGNIYGAHEGFVEIVRSNMSLVRRRIKSPYMQFNLFSVTSISSVDVVVAFMSDRVPKSYVEKVKKKLREMDLEAVLSSGYAEPFLNDTKLSVFSGVSVTERPDVFCAKLLEGRVGVLIDGTPFALVLPALFIENFQTLDDYAFRPYFTTFIRWIRYIAFFTAIFLPAFYAAVATFHPELFNHTLMTVLAGAEELAPLPLALEALFVLIFYEIIREAGVRLPKSVGGAVSIVGGLIIGDAAVSAGVISNPLLLVCAISVTAGFVLPSLNQPVTVLRIAVLIAGGIMGLYGVALAAAVMLVNICSLESSGAPVMSPLSPFTPRSMRDVLTRAGFKKMGGRPAYIGRLSGVHISEEEREEKRE